MPATPAEWLFTIIGTIMTILGAILAYVVKQKDREIVDLQTQQSEIKQNYLERFEKLTKIVTDGNAATIQAISDLKVDVLQKFVRREDCPFLHKQ
jgi:hypothetical protein